MNDMGSSYCLPNYGELLADMEREELMYLWRGQVIIRSDGRWNELITKRCCGTVRRKQYTGNETETDTRILNNSFGINGLNVVHIVR